MCYTTTTHYSRCPHRTSTTTLCPHSTYRRPAIYHPPTHHARPCGPNGGEGDVLVRRDGLCEACSRVSSWFLASGGPSDSDSNMNGTGALRVKRDKSPAAQMGGPPPPYHPYAKQDRTPPPPGPAEPVYPLLTGVQEGRCPLSEAFERVLKIGNDQGLSMDGSRGARGGVGGGRTRKQEGQYGPLKPRHSSTDADNGVGGVSGVGFSSRPRGHGGRAGRRARRTTRKKQVRFAPKVEVLYFRRDWATRTLRSLSREHRARR